MRVLVTGGTGILGRKLVERLRANSHEVRVMSHRPGAGDVTGDLATGEGLAGAVEGVDAIAHCASSPLRKVMDTDVQGAGRLMKAARDAGGSAHVLYISIVGIDRFPRLRYYQAKLSVERTVEASDLPWTILRATQFHDLIAFVLSRLVRAPAVMPVPRHFRFQPVDPGEVAGRMADLLEAGPSEKVDDMGGPEVRVMGDLARSYLDARGARRRLLEVPLPGPTAAGFRRGDNTCTGHARGTVTWEEWLSRHVRD